MHCLSYRLRFLALVQILVVNFAVAGELRTPTTTIPDTYFGLHIHHLDRPVPTPWPAMPVPTWRLWDADVNWADIQPSKGQWQFDRLDRYVLQAQKHGTRILFPLGGTPTWASAQPRMPSNYQLGFTAEPANTEDWRTFVRTVVMRYKHRIQAYEIWNEPNLRDFWTGSMDQMLELTREASEIIRALDPEAVLVSPAATADYGIRWLEDFLKKGGGKYVDVIGYHFYVNPHTRLPEEMVPLVQLVRQILAENGVAEKPLWNTETGWLPPAKFASEEMAAAFLARAYILAWATGIQRFYWYAWDNRSLAIVTFQEGEGRITAAGRAYKVMEEWLVGARMDSCTQSADGLWTCELNRSGKKEWIVWNQHGDRNFPLPAAWHARSITPLLRQRESLKESSVAIGPLPTLITQQP